MRSVELTLWPGNPSLFLESLFPRCSQGQMATMSVLHLRANLISILITTKLPECSHRVWKSLCASRNGLGRVLWHATSRHCANRPFWSWLHSLRTHTDIHECNARAHNCDVNGECRNTDGSFSCQCSAGYTGSGTVGNCTGKRGVVLKVSKTSKISVWVQKSPCQLVLHHQSVGKTDDKQVWWDRACHP